MCVWFVLLNLLGPNFCPLHFNVQYLWLSCQDHLYSSMGFTAYLAAVCVDSQHHKTLMGNRISEEKHGRNALALRQRFMVVYVWWIFNSTWKRINSPWCIQVHFGVWNWSGLLMHFYRKLWLISVVSVQHNLITKSQTAHTSC